MAYLIDTDVVLDHFAAVEAATQLLDELAPSGLFISIITYMESYQGVMRQLDQREAHDQFMAFLLSVPPVPFSEEAARRCALLREALRLEGKRVRPRALDLMTAATALTRDPALVARNGRDYADIAGLQLRIVSPW